MPFPIRTVYVCAKGEKRARQMALPKPVDDWDGTWLDAEAKISKQLPKGSRLIAVTGVKFEGEDHGD